MATPYITSPLESIWSGLGATIGTHGNWRVAESFAGASAELQAARERVALGDDTSRGKIRLQGASVALVAGAIGAADAPVGQLVRAGSAEVARLRPDIAHVGTPADALQSTLAALADAAVTQGATCTDVTHGRYELRLVGPLAAELLSKVCGLDFHDSAFADQTARETSVAKTKQLVVRSDLGDVQGYRLLGGRALGAYMWATLMEAGDDLGIEPIGTAGLGALQAS